jgi:hypothetical protein
VASHSKKIRVERIKPGTVVRVGKGSTFLPAQAKPPRRPGTGGK